jgi:hypothetical protein
MRDVDLMWLAEGIEIAANLPESFQVIDIVHDPAFVSSDWNSKCGLILTPYD